MGFNSRPPLCRLERVTAKSAPLRAPAVTKSNSFCLSQNLCSPMSGCGTETYAEACGKAPESIRASGIGPCAKDVGHVTRAKRRIPTAALSRLVNLPQASILTRCGQHFENGQFGVQPDRFGNRANILRIRRLHFLSPEKQTR